MINKTLLLLYILIVMLSVNRVHGYWSDGIYFCLLRLVYGYCGRYTGDMHPTGEIVEHG